MENLVTMTRSTAASVLVVSADEVIRKRISSALEAQRWAVWQAAGGAAALLMMEQGAPQAVLLEGPLPDLQLEGFASEVRAAYPEVDLISLDSSILPSAGSPRNPRRGELLQVLRSVTGSEDDRDAPDSILSRSTAPGERGKKTPVTVTITASTGKVQPGVVDAIRGVTTTSGQVPELIGQAPAMLEVSRRIRLVASRSTTVLIQGPTGSGKEVVARALHRLSPRAERPFVALNCAAIPEALLEAELFGHARGAFTGAVQRRTGRIEAAQGGTLFLDEIGEMPLALQAKLLRFLESGELQRVGENDTVHVDVRMVAATHQPLAQRAREGGFRADLFYRLAVFLIRTPALADHLEDLPALAEHFLAGFGAKQLTPGAEACLRTHSWPGNVRELQHVLERATILAEDRPVISPEEIEFDEVAVTMEAVSVLAPASRA